MSEILLEHSIHRVLCIIPFFGQNDAKLFECKETPDVTFVAEGHNFDVHKCTLFCKCKKLYEIANNRFECIDLKLDMESVITFYDLKFENTAELLIFANSYSRALLREAATKLYIRDTKTVKKLEAWSRFLESNQVLAELLVTYVRPERWGRKK